MVCEGCVVALASPVVTGLASRIPDSRENTGNFGDSHPSKVHAVRVSALKTSAYTCILNESEQGIISLASGNSFAQQEIMLAPALILLRKPTIGSPSGTSQIGSPTPAPPLRQGMFERGIPPKKFSVGLRPSSPLKAVRGDEIE